MKIFKKLFQNSFTRETEILEAHLDSVDYISGNIPASFYTRLFEIFISKTPKSDTNKYQTYYNEFKNNVERLIPHFDRLVNSGLSKKQLDEFLKNFEVLARKDYGISMINSQTISYWYQPFRKYRDSIHSSGELEQIKLVDELNDKIRDIADSVINI